MLKEYFMQYLTAVRNVKPVTIKKYLSAIGVINSHLNSSGYFVEDLFAIDTIEEMDRIKDFLFNNSEFIIKDETGNRMYSTAFNHFYKFACQGEISTKQEIQKLDIVLPPPMRVVISRASKWQRNQIIVTQVIQSTNYSCEYDANHKTFTSNKTKQNYVEGHHIIPMENQDKFNVSLDVYANIVSLCPTCHRLLHHGIRNEKIYVLEKIYAERNERLCNSGINIGINDFINVAI